MLQFNASEMKGNFLITVFYFLLRFQAKIITQSRWLSGLNAWVWSHLS